MAHRQLSETERAVLADRSLNPDGWWNHLCLMFTATQAESQLAERITRWRPAYEAAVAEPGYLPFARRKTN